MYHLARMFYFRIVRRGHIYKALLFYRCTKKRSNIISATMDLLLTASRSSILLASIITRILFIWRLSDILSCSALFLLYRTFCYCTWFAPINPPSVSSVKVFYFHIWSLFFSKVFTNFWRQRWDLVELCTCQFVVHFKRLSRRKSTHDIPCYRPIK